MKIDNSKLYRFLLPIIPFGSILSIASTILLDLRFSLDILVGFLCGLLISELMYYFYKDVIYVHNDKIVLKKGENEKRTILFSNIISVSYSKRNNYSEGTFGYGPITKYFNLEMKQGEVYNLQFETLFFSQKMKDLLVILKDAGIQLNAEALSKISKKL